MKPTVSRLLFAAPLFFSFVGNVSAADIAKGDNIENLALGGSWALGSAPGANDIALWDSVVTAANSSVLGANVTWGGLKLTAPGGAVTIGAGDTLTLGKDGIDMSAATQDLSISSGLTLLGGTAQTWNVASGRTLTLDTGTFTRSAGASLNIQGAGTVVGTNFASNVNGIVGPWATSGSDTSLSYVTKNGSNQIVAFTTGTNVALAGGNGGGANTATVNYNVTGAATLSGGRSVNTMRFVDTAAQTYAILNRSLTANGLMNAGTATWNITGTTGSVTVGNSLELAIATNTQAINITAMIINNGGGASALTFNSGGGTLTLSGANTFSGATTISGGTLYANRTNAASNMVFSFTSGITINSGATLRTSANGLFGWDGTQERDITVKSGGILTANAGADVGVGLVTLAGGTLANLGASATFGSWRFDGATDKLAVTENSVMSAVNVKFQNGGSVDVAAGKTLSVTGTITNSSSGGVSALVKTGNGAVTFSEASSYTGATTISGGTLALVGAGSISASQSIIVGASTTFDVSGVAGGYTLAAGQTLSGPGTVVGAATIAGTLSPGSSPGTLSTDSQVWIDGGDYNWQIADATGSAGAGYDNIAIAGTLDLSNAGLTAGGFGINLWSLSSSGPDVSGDAANFNNLLSQSWTLLTTTGGISGFDAADFTINVGAANGTAGFANALDPQGTFQIAQSGNSLVLNYSVVPEPGAALLGGLGMMLMLRRRRNA